MNHPPTAVGGILGRCVSRLGVNEVSTTAVGEIFTPRRRQYFPLKGNLFPLTSGSTSIQTENFPEIRSIVAFKFVL
jgi:hypothetical protein